MKYKANNLIAKMVEKMVRLMQILSFIATVFPLSMLITLLHVLLELCFSSSHPFIFAALKL